MSPLLSGFIGLASGLIIAVVGKAIDIWQRGRVRELDIARLVGEVHAHGEDFAARLRAIEQRVEGYDARLSSMNSKLDSVMLHIGCGEDEGRRTARGR